MLSHFLLFCSKNRRIYLTKLVVVAKLCDSGSNEIHFSLFAIMHCGRHHSLSLSPWKKKKTFAVSVCDGGFMEFFASVCHFSTHIFYYNFTLVFPFSKRHVLVGSLSFCRILFSLVHSEFLNQFFRFLVFSRSFLLNLSFSLHFSLYLSFSLDSCFFYSLASFSVRFVFSFLP